MFRKKLKSGELDDTEIELDIADNASPMSMFEIPGQPGADGRRDEPWRYLRQSVSGRDVRRKMTVAESYEILVDEEADKTAGR